MLFLHVLRRCTSYRRMSRWGRKARPPEGFDYLEPTLAALEAELREKVNEPHEGLRKCESLWPVHQINWQRSRYIFDMYYKYKKISREVYDYCVNMKLCDAALAAKWKKPGYEKLCCTYAINTKNFKFGTVSICRVPKKFLSDDTAVEDVNCGCRGCASGDQGEKNIFGNKFGQYLARIQVARERKREAKEKREHDEYEAEAAAEEDGPQPAPTSVWAADASEELYDDDDDVEGGGGRKRGGEADKETDAFLKAHKKAKR